MRSRRAMKQVSAEHLLRHGPFLRGLAQALLRDSARADDVVQEAYLAALRGAPAEEDALRNADSTNDLRLRIHMGKARIQDRLVQVQTEA